ncbi:SDR family oxidoreductase [Chachezhania sediminis]|uniref:SDR family oxidoreductase n=1 Tax=Chachezhania sediminis TaxID=2599291 RepID=UPI00131EB0E3|nr:SDR family NAD(P)-dependent oxidoreductase [Chachezhania sediminis]
MSKISGRTAVVTGAGSGIGRAIAKSLAERGAAVMLADIDPARLAEVQAELRQVHDRIATCPCDVADPAAVRTLADTTLDRFGSAHIVVNNAGVALGGRPGAIALEDWRWIVGINLMGVVHGVETFLPILRSQGQGGHFVNTASIAGHIAMPGLGPYNATKYAVVGYSETLQKELEPDGIGVSVLCPGWVRTDIHNTGLKRPSLGGAVPPAQANAMSDAVETGIDPADVGDWTAEAVESGRLYLFTHPSMAPWVEARAAAVAQDYAACAADPRFAKA